MGCVTFFGLRSQGSKCQCRVKHQAFCPALPHPPPPPRSPPLPSTPSTPQGDKGFLSPSRLALYDTKRNDPAEPQASNGKAGSDVGGALLRLRSAMGGAVARGTLLAVQQCRWPPLHLRICTPHTRHPAHGNAQALSNLSPWLHYGQLAPQRAALEAAKLRSKHKVRPARALPVIWTRRSGMSGWEIW